MVANDIHKIIKSQFYYDDNRWLYLPELRSTTGLDSQRTIDGFAIALWPSDKFIRVAYEIKVSASDFNAELRQPKKREPWTRLANEFYFVAPKGIINSDRVPVGCGLMEYDPDTNKIKTIIESDYHEGEPNWGLICSILRDVMRKGAADDKADV